MSKRISCVGLPSRNGKRYRKQINGRVYDICLTGNTHQRELAYKELVEKLIKQHKDRKTDGSQTWAFFVSAFLKSMRKEKGRLNTQSADEHFNELDGKLRATLKALAVQIQPKVYEYGFLKD